MALGPLIEKGARVEKTTLLCMRSGLVTKSKNPSKPSSFPFLPLLCTF